MTDLVKRLRASVANEPNTLQAQAAARIERLEAALREIENAPSKMIWGEDYEVKYAMDAMQSTAEEALKENRS